MKGEGGEVRGYNVSLITGINPAKEFIPFLSISEGTCAQGIRGIARHGPKRKLVRYFPRTCTKYLYRYANFIPSAQPARLVPTPLSDLPL